uniref:Chitin-binding type-2 domain-containing protein n=1 Tax=Timema cristinae TaxID=61476 RepID=A0A7R9D7A2_TIMCR|nr:unnamed protein product [Timema cristinae]
MISHGVPYLTSHRGTYARYVQGSCHHLLYTNHQPIRDSWYTNRVNRSSETHRFQRYAATKRNTRLLTAATNGSRIMKAILTLFQESGAQSCSTDIYCYNSTVYGWCIDGAVVEQAYDCPTGTFCSSDCESFCAKTVPCTSTITTAPEIYQCTATGIFPDVSNYSNYYLCSPKSSGGYYTYLYHCPSGFLFDSDNGVCTPNASVVYGPRCNDYGFYCLTNTTLQLCADKDVAAGGDVYTCNDGNYCSMDCSSQCSEIVPCTSTTTTTASTTEASFECHSAGRFADTTNCHMYYLCVAKTSGGYYQTLYSCPPGSAYNSTKKTCTYSDYSTCRVSTTAAATIDTETFECASSGKFSDSNNSSNYILCVQNTNGGFYQTTYSCPSGSLFNYTTGACTYSSVTYSTSVTSIVAIVSGVSGVVVDLLTNIISCSSSGKFADSSSCKMFYVCSSNPSGGYYTYHFTCPDISVYNSTTQTCSMSSRCFKGA